LTIWGLHLVKIKIWIGLKIACLRIPLWLSRLLPRLTLIIIAITVITITHFNLFLQSLINPQILWLVAHKGWVWISRQAFFAISRLIRTFQRTFSARGRRNIRNCQSMLFALRYPSMLVEISTSVLLNLLKLRYS